MSDRATIEAQLSSVIERLRKAGDSWWPGNEIAPIAYRRLNSFGRRNQSKHPTQTERVNDLAKGLQAHFEPEVPYTHPNDWRHLALNLVESYESLENSE